MFPCFTTDIHQIATTFFSIFLIKSNFKYNYCIRPQTSYSLFRDLTILNYVGDIAYSHGAMKYGYYT